jgi:hypothetical protein
MHSEKSWSLLDPKPITRYVSSVDEYIVYWNGKVMPHSMALCMTMEMFGIYPTPEMKNALEKNYRKIYYSNGFDTRAWDKRVEQSEVYIFLKRIMLDHVKKTLEGKEAKDVIAWFDYSRARKDDIKNADTLS